MSDKKTLEKILLIIQVGGISHVQLQKTRDINPFSTANDSDHNFDVSDWDN